MSISSKGSSRRWRAACGRRLYTLQALGAQVQQVSLPHTEYALPVYYLIAPAEASANLARFDGIRYGPRQPAEAMWDVFRRTRGEKFGAEVKRRIMLGTYALSAGYYDAYYGQAQKVRTLIKQDFEQAFEQVDVIAAPVAPTTAFKIGRARRRPAGDVPGRRVHSARQPGGRAGLTFPVGFDAEGLPVGMQLMGPHFRRSGSSSAAATPTSSDWTGTCPTADLCRSYPLRLVSSMRFHEEFTHV